MSDKTYQLIAILLYFVIMAGIGIYAFRRTKSVDGYMLADRGLSPTMAALSANAADMSGWLLMALPGAIYAAGLFQAWIAIGLTAGAWLNWKFVAPRLRAYSEVADNAITIPSFFSKRLKFNARPVRILAATIILVFFTFYVSSGMVAAGKFFVTSFDWNYHQGFILVAAITVGYTFFGGFLGVTLTDVSQGLLMLASLVVVPVVAIIQLGGWDNAVGAVTSVNPQAFNLFAGLEDKGILLWTVGLISTAAWGLGYFGQPHIIVRFMALRSASEAKIAGRISLAWMSITAGGAILAALIGIGYFAGNPKMSLKDSESVILVLSQIFFHPLVAGIVLAAVLAAIMSTMSSQLIVCASALAEDLYTLLGRKKDTRHMLIFSRLSVLTVAVVAAIFALDQDNAVLELVSFAWAGFGAAFGPVMLLALYWRKLTAQGAFVGMLAGAITAFVWGYVDVLSDAMYEIVPGFLLNLVLCVLVSKATYRPHKEVDEEFETMLRALKTT